MIIILIIIIVEYFKYLIQYIIPKSINDNILELVKDKNFIYEDELNEKKKMNILLHVPKFRIDNEIVYNEKNWI